MMTISILGNKDQILGSISKELFTKLFVALKLKRQMKITPINTI